MVKIAKFQGYLEYRGKFWGEKMRAVCKSIYQLKDNFVSFPLLFISTKCSFFNENCCYCSNFLKNRKTAQSSPIWQKKLKKTPKIDENFRKFGFKGKFGQINYPDNFENVH